MEGDKEKTMYIDFDGYIRQGEPEKRNRADAWRVAIGLQAVDGLKTSAYLQELARRNIEGEITIDEVKTLIDQYYAKKKEGRVQPNLSTQQVPEQVPEQVDGMLRPKNPIVSELVKVIGLHEYAVSEMMQVMELKHRPNFLEYHLNPAIAEGFVQMLYPDKPRHPRQKYLLTAKGIMLYNQMMKKD